MKKKFLPAKLSEWADRWMIVYHQVDPATGKRVRFKRSYELNRIKSIAERRKRAKILIKELNEELLPEGYPFVEVVRKEDNQFMPVMEALEYSLRLKFEITSPAAYKYSINLLKGFLLEKKLNHKTVDVITPHLVNRFLNYLSIDKNLSNTTRNNTASFLRSLFNALLSDHIIKVNPFSNFKVLKAAQKERRPLDKKEKLLLANHIQEHNPRLYLGILLMYYCFIRKAEMLRLKYRYFDFKNKLIRLPGTKTKNKKSQTLTLPDELAKILLEDYHFLDQPQEYYIFGPALKSGTRPAGKNQLTKLHRQFVTQLEKKKELVDAKSIHFYSWKDTGVLNMVELDINIVDIQKQLRHTSLETTQRYLITLYDRIDNIHDMALDV